MFFVLNSYGQNDNNIKKIKQSLTRYYEKKETGLYEKDSTYLIVLKELREAFHLKNKDSSDYYLQEEIYLAKDLGLKKKEAYLHKYFGMNLMSRGEYSRAILSFDKALELQENLSYSNEMTLLYYSKAKSYLMLNNLTKSFLFINKVLLDYQKEKNEYGLANAYNILAILYSKQEKNDLVLESYNKGLLSIKDNPSNKAHKIREFLEFNLGVYHLGQEKYKKALKIFLTFYDNPIKESNLQKGKTAKVIGETYYKLLEYDKAEKFHNIAINIHIKAGKKEELADAYIGIGEIYFAQKKNQKAINFTKEGLVISNKVGELSTIKIAYKNLAKFYASQKKYKEAYLNHYEFKKISDSIFNHEINDEVNDLQHQYDLERQEESFRIKQVHKDEINSKEDKNQTLLFSILLFFIILLCFIVIGVYRTLKKSKRQQIIIENSVRIKDVLLREIHHRVKNNLQIIIGLFGIQSQQLQDENTLKIINDGQRRVQAMSLIHEGLYRAEDISNIEIKKYLKELVNHLSQVFIGDDNNITVHIEADQIYFDIDTTVPLGLIINELLSNSFKYGFSKQQVGNIYIKIERKNKIDYSLEVSNDGIPLAENFNIHRTNSFGLKLVHLLSKQLRGAFFNKSTPKKTIFNVQFKDLCTFNNLSKK